ncbi:hypothetical protein DL766_010441 [Monosporascus sp. MC13-8B]|uniref:Berberine/berberine-like domain-containing protein n=1 Tax=Monosporascus cannonballus TaxID=155416 RepID=A0ABY0H3K4_9PEZI|nr:hypothetical protein DL762_007419 [Monosporascus cannonballus]RYO84220.1 hypothetical protein DL763_007544 [Monosporascus cannonballus]RYP01795.1 hypothetical protein DL766_010441 [Monosporascus sp. MC13-8B]
MDPQVILADGSLVNANAESHTDLFWALKGGGNNFGIVTSFTLSTYPLPKVWGGVKGYSWGDLPLVHASMLEYQSNPQKDPYANLMLQGFPINGTLGVMLSMVYLKPDESPPAFEPFYSISTTMDSMKTSTYYELLASQGSVDLPRIDLYTTSFTPNEALYRSLDSIVTTSHSLEEVKSVTAGSLALGFQPISSTAIEAGYARGDNALGLEAVNQTWYVIDVGWYWPSDDDFVRVATEDMIGQVEKASKAEDSHVHYLFKNDANHEQDVIGSYGEENVRRLRDAQAKYDPDRVFQKLMPGGWKLS